MKIILKMNRPVTASNDYIDGAELTLSIANDNIVKMQIGSSVIELDKAMFLEASKIIEDTDFYSGRNLGLKLTADKRKDINELLEQFDLKKIE